MQRATAEEEVVFSAGSLRLEGRIAVPAGATRAVVVCHPHPEYGGMMDNNVVLGATLALREAGVATLRFNFRGVGGSEGRYSGGSWAEADDARAAVATLAQRVPQARMTLAGYSFGAMVALLAGHDWPEIERLIAIALPATMFDTGFLEHCAKPKLFLLGDTDQYCRFGDLESLVGRCAGGNRLVRLEGADHFLFGLEERIGEELVGFVR
jgi:alpha/beta superfamily hydrolase